MASTCCELMWISSLLQNLQVDHSQAALLFCDSQVALHIAINHFFQERKKHIEMFKSKFKRDCHFQKSTRRRVY
jgi:hypothetical protein